MSKPKTQAKCHPEKENYGNGLCRTCYSKQERNSRPFASCHPKYRVYMDDLCSGCYKRKKYNEDPEYRDSIRKQRSEYSKTENGRNSVRKYRLKRAYGISLSGYDLLLQKQQNKCGVCEKHISECKRVLCVDHDHITGLIRGLLCDKCNRGIGLLQDSPEILIKALRYLGVSSSE